jgi:hypothetical protein
MSTANINPIFSRIGDVSTNGTTGMAQLVTASAADYTGISANYALVYTADATNGSFVQRLRFKAGGTNVAAVARIFINNGSTNTTATNNAFYGEVSLPATTAATTSATIEIDYPMGFALNPSFRIYWGLGAAVAAGWVCVAVAGPY